MKGVNEATICIHTKMFVSYFAVVMAVSIPNLELFISLTGSFCLSVLAIAIPAIVETFAHWRNRGLGSQFAVLMFKNFLILLISVFAFVVGVSSAIGQYFGD